jgi:hypothetical protein
VFSLGSLRQFRNYCGLIKIARCGFPWKKTTKRPITSVYTNCETSLELTYRNGGLCNVHGIAEPKDFQPGAVSLGLNL